MLAKKWFDKNKEALIIFGFFLIVWLLYDGPVRAFHKSYFMLHYLDSSIGFCSRTFIGTVVKLIAGNTPSLAFVKCFITGNLLLCFVLLSVILGKVVKKFKERPVIICIVVFLIFGLCSFRYCLTGYWTSSFDPYWLTCALLSVVLLGKRLGKWLIPLILFVGMWIHYAFIFTYAPLIFILLIYKLYIEKEHKKSYIALLVVSAIVFLGATVYFYGFANGTIDMTMQQTHEYLRGRLPEGENYNFVVVDSYFFGKLEFTDNVIGNKPLKLIIEVIKISLGAYGDSVIPDASVFIGELPILLLTGALWLRMIKSDKRKSFRIIALLTLLLPISGIVSTLATTDDFRFMAFSVVTQLTALLWLTYNGEENVTAALYKVEIFIKKKDLPYAAFLIPLLFITNFSENFVMDAAVYYPAEIIVFALSVFLIIRQKPWYVALIATVATVIEPGFGINFGVPLSLYMVYDALVTRPLNTKDTKAHSVVHLKTNKLVASTTVLIIPCVITAIEYFAFNRTYFVNMVGMYTSEKEFTVKVALCCVAMLAVTAAVFLLTRRSAVCGISTVFSAFLSVASAAILIIYQTGIIKEEYIMRYTPVISVVGFPVFLMLLRYRGFEDLTHYKDNRLFVPLGSLALLFVICAAGIITF